MHSQNKVISLIEENISKNEYLEASLMLFRHNENLDLVEFKKLIYKIINNHCK